MKDKVEKIYDRITSGADDITGGSSDVELSLQQVINNLDSIVLIL